MGQWPASFCCISMPLDGLIWYAEEYPPGNWEGTSTSTHQDGRSVRYGYTHFFPVTSTSLQLVASHLPAIQKVLLVPWPPTTTKQSGDGGKGLTPPHKRNV